MAQEYSFDVVSRFDRQELVNAVDQARREFATRFDFKGITAEITLNPDSIVLLAESEGRRLAMLDVLKTKMIRRHLSTKILDEQKPEPASRGTVRQLVKLRAGIGEDLARELVKRVRAVNPKVTVRVQGDELRVVSREKDLLQAAIKRLREAEDLPVPLQFVNYR